MTKTKKGFTLIELVVVMAIIAVLAALMVVAISAARKQATNTQIMGDAKAYETALETYSSKNNGKYPIAPGSAVKDVDLGVGKLLVDAKVMTAMPASTSIYYYTTSGTKGAPTSSYTLIACPDGISPQTAPQVGNSPDPTGLCGVNGDVNAVYVTAR